MPVDPRDPNIMPRNKIVEELTWLRKAVLELEAERDQFAEQVDTLRALVGGRVRVSLAAMELAEAYCAWVTCRASDSIDEHDRLADALKAAFRAYRATAEQGGGSDG